jgi:NFU1 iron-sulfur cluster scaffold homolog, mitochondrial
LNFIKRFFTGMKQDVEPEPSVVVKEVEESQGDKVVHSEPETETGEASNFPPIRRVLQISAISEGIFPKDSDEVLIKAQPSPTGDQCLFTINRSLMKGYSWYFSGFESAAESPLAEALFCLDDLETVLVCESTVMATRKDKTLVDWVPFAKEIGAAIREVLLAEKGIIAEKIISDLPTEGEIRDGIQKVIDTEVNPGVAGHGGNVSLLAVKGNSVTIQMGGGCQGCSAADLTLKQGIHTSFRNAVPKVGAIFDETDHTAGLNPYFS